MKAAKSINVILGNKLKIYYSKFFIQLHHGLLHIRVRLHLVEKRNIEIRYKCEEPILNYNLKAALERSGTTTEFIVLMRPFVL